MTSHIDIEGREGPSGRSAGEFEARKGRVAWHDLEGSLWWLNGSRWRTVFRVVWMGKRLLPRYGLIVIKRDPRPERRTG